MIPHQVKETKPRLQKNGLMGLMGGVGGATRTVTRTYKTPMLILCTGKHVTPFVPAIPTDGSVPMIHSSQVGIYLSYGGGRWIGGLERAIIHTHPPTHPTPLPVKKKAHPFASTHPPTPSPQVHDWSALTGKSVAVVGAGASALDMAINALKANETQELSSGAAQQPQLHWLLRSPKHFSGFDYADLFLLTIFQVRPIIHYISIYLCIGCVFGPHLFFFIGG